MFKKLIKLSKKTKAPLNKSTLFGVLIYQSIMIFIALIVAVFFPGDPNAITFIFIGWGISMILLIEGLESKNGIVEQIPLEFTKK